MKPLVEAVVWSVADAIAAQKCGCDRIELVTALELDGLTPSQGLVKEVLATCSLPVMAMVRPRDGHFVYGEFDIATMEREVDALVEAGAHGIVTGLLTVDDEIDVAAMKRLARRCEGMQKVCHRAFDRCTDPDRALGALIDLGFDRILTSGGADTSIEGAEAVRKIIERAGSDIEVLPVGGIRVGTAKRTLELTGANQIHLAPMKLIGTGPGLFGGGYNVLDIDELAKVVAEVKG